MLEQAFTLMLLGMGTVFTFLTLLIFATILMSRLLERFSPVPEIPAPAPLHKDPVLIAAISAAIHQHRKNRH